MMRGRDPSAPDAVADMRHGGGSFVAIDGDAHEFRAGERQRHHLARGRLDVGGVGVGHRLHDDRRACADKHVADAHADRGAARRRAKGGQAGLDRGLDWMFMAAKDSGSC